MARHLCLYRNGTIGNSRDAAIKSLTEVLKGLNDGEIAINRYKDEKNNIKVLIGFATKKDDASISEKSTTIFDADAIPSDVLKKLDVINGEGEGSIKKAVNDAKNALIGGDDDTSVSNTIRGAKKYTDGKIGELTVADTAETSKFVTSVSETNGKISISRGAVTSTNKTIGLTNGADGGIDINVNIDEKTIVKNTDTGVLSVASSALTQYVGSDAVKVSDVDSSNNKTVSLFIKDGENVLSQDENGLATTLSIAYEGNSRKVQLKGKNDELISEFDATAFVKDGMLKEAKVFTAEGTEQAITFDDKTTNEYTGLKVGNHYIAFEFNVTGGASTEASYQILDATTIIDVYKAGNGLALGEDKHTFSIKIADGSETFLAVDENGIKLSGVQGAIDTAAASAKTVVTEAKGNVRVKVSSNTETDGHITYTISEDDIAQKSLLEAEVTRSTKLDNAIIGGVGLGTDGTHSKATGNYTKDATTITGEIAALDAQVKTNADAIGNNKTTIDGYTINGKAISTSPSFTGENAIAIDNDLKVTLKLKETDSNLVNNADGLSLADTIDCGEYYTESNA